MPVAFETPELRGAEALKSFENNDALGKAYLDLHGKVSSGDVSIISEELRKDPSLASFKNVNDIAKSYVETKKLVGSIKKPPETADGYKFTALQNTHPGLKDVPGTQKILGAILHEAGVPNDGADLVQQKIITLLSNALVKQDEARKVKGQEVETALRGEWKENYDKNKQTVETVLKRAGAEELAASIGGNPVALRAMAKITALLSEDSIGKLEGGSAQNITDKQQAEKRIQEIIKENNTAKGALLDEKHKDHAKVKEEWDRLHKVAYGTEGA